KAAVELPIPFDGAVHELRFDEGTTVDVGTAIISVDTDPSAGPLTGSGDVAGEAAASGGDGEGQEPEAEAGESSGGRQPVLVGYGVSEASTKRRPRKPQASDGGQDVERAAGQRAV
ncbi:2-oxo acid dehydrogenase subunit E2, partial [Streptomyces daliensis]|nr:2-oxo acid dehydrogenase subunit E2 [Streptomyces daliensis]